MEPIQVRLPEGLVKEIDRLVSKGYYGSRSDFIREAIRNGIPKATLWDKLIRLIKR